jgi:hypothetical protein
MPTVEVFYDNSTAYMPGAIASRDPGHLFAKIAEVEVSAHDCVQRTLEEAFGRCQNDLGYGEKAHSRLWQDDPTVRVFNIELAGPGFRSCRVGDWMRINGRVYRVATFGFDEMPELPDLPRYSPHPARTVEEEPMNPEDLNIPPELLPMCIPEMAKDPAEVLRLALLSDEELDKEIEAAMKGPTGPGARPEDGLRDLRPVYEKQLRSMLSAHDRTERIASFKAYKR